MNSIVLVLSVFLLGKLNRSSFVESWRWTAPIARLKPVRDIYISRGTSISQSIGFAIIGLAASYPGVVIGKFGQDLNLVVLCQISTSDAD